MTALCIELKWDYFTYMAQPTWFIESIKLYYKQQHAKMKKEAARSKKR